MKKSILDLFAADAINAPATVTGGGGSKGSKGSSKKKSTPPGQEKKSDKSKGHCDP